MDKVVIEVPKGKVAEVTKLADENVLVTFKNVEHWKLIKNVDDACNYLRKEGICEDLVHEYEYALHGSYSEVVAAYRVVVAALTNNDKCHLLIWERWIPLVEFCKPGNEKNCYGREIIGFIESEGKKFIVVGGRAIRNPYYTGIGNFFSAEGVSSGYSISSLTASSKEIAEHISKYFGRLFCEFRYGGVNRNWKWIN